MPRSVQIGRPSSGGQLYFFSMAIAWLVIAAASGFLAHGEGSSSVARDVFFAAVVAIAITAVLGVVRADRARRARPGAPGPR